jgi:uncharacterized protein YegP (UPF0339 family)
VDTVVPVPARYQCLGLGTTWAWRLLGSNHRDLARATGRFATLDEAVADALAVAAEARAATIEVSLGPDAAWHWVMSVDGDVRAASSVGYTRRLECVRAVDRFRECAEGAEVSSVPLVRRASGRAAGRPRAAGAESRRADVQRPTRQPPPHPR